MTFTSSSTNVLIRPRVLFFGATGYIGGSVLGRLIQQPARASYEIVAYLRNEDKAKVLVEQLAISTIIGTLEDSDKIENAAADADIVIHTAESADHIGSVQAILEGLKRKYLKSGNLPIYIHTSGAAVFADDARGMKSDSIVYDDTNVTQIKSIPEGALHRNVDLVVAAADEEGYVRTYNITPSVVYGVATGPLFDLKLANSRSVLVPALVKISVARGRSGMFGGGNNVWPLVHIEDLADLYMLLFDTLVSDSRQTSHGWNGFYFAENGSFSFREASHSIGTALASLGKIKEGGSTAYTEEELARYWGGSNLLGANARCSSTRSRQIGWNPRHTKDDFLASIKPEVDIILASGTLDKDDSLSQLLNSSKEQDAAA